MIYGLMVYKEIELDGIIPEGKVAILEPENMYRFDTLVEALNTFGEIPCYFSKVIKAETRADLEKLFKEEKLKFRKTFDGIII